MESGEGNVYANITSTRGGAERAISGRPSAQGSRRGKETIYHHKTKNHEQRFIKKKEKKEDQLVLQRYVPFIENSNYIKLTKGKSMLKLGICNQIIK